MFFLCYNDAKTMAEGCRLADGGVVMNKILIAEDEAHYSTESKICIVISREKGNCHTVWPRGKNCDAETKKSPVFQEPTQLTVLPPLFSPVSRCVPSAEEK